MFHKDFSQCRLDIMADSEPRPSTHALRLRKDGSQDITPGLIGCFILEHERQNLWDWSFYLFAGSGGIATVCASVRIAVGMHRWLRKPIRSLSLELKNSGPRLLELKSRSMSGLLSFKAARFKEPLRRTPLLRGIDKPPLWFSFSGPTLTFIGLGMISQATTERRQLEAKEVELQLRYAEKKRTMTAAANEQKIEMLEQGKKLISRESELVQREQDVEQSLKEMEEREKGLDQYEEELEERKENLYRNEEQLGEREENLEEIEMALEQREQDLAEREEKESLELARRSTAQSEIVRAEKGQRRYKGEH